jgi:hypothetical protein
MNVKSERLKKLETELHDLEQWLKLGLVPKKDMEKHKEEMRLLQHKIEEERVRLRYLKESGEMEGFAIPKRQAGRPVEPHSLPDIDIAEEGMTDAGLETETEPFDIETTSAGEVEEEATSPALEDESGYAEEEEEEEEEDPFSDRNRWRRGILEDPDVKDW